MAMRWYRSLDSLLVAAELARLGRHQEAAKFLIGATKAPEYMEMAEALTQEQEQRKEQQASEDGEQQEQQEQQSAVMSKALARVLEGADVYPDEDVSEDEQQEQQQEQASEDDQQQEEEASEDEDQQQEQADLDDLGIDLDEQDDLAPGGDQEQQLEAALASLSKPAVAKPAAKPVARKPAVAGLSERQARLARNKGARA